jgi:hypothetical protein
MEGRLHRRGGNPVGIDDPGLYRQDDKDRADDREDPVEDDPLPVREVREEALDRAAHGAG